MCVRKFIDWVRQQDREKLTDILELIDLHQTLDIRINPDPMPRDRHAVQIMTAHKSKGMEFEVVFIPGLEDRKWGNPRSKMGIALPRVVENSEEKYKKEIDISPPLPKGDARGISCIQKNPSSVLPLKKGEVKKGKIQDENIPLDKGGSERPTEASRGIENEEERRLFFVALTRAKSQIYLTYARTDFDGREKNPSMFWHEVPEHLSTDISSPEQEEDIQSLLPVFLSGQEKTFTATEKSLLQERIKNFVWSASSLQNYLDCPRRFLYQNLYRFPRRPVPQMALGVALHQALERWFNQIKKEEIRNKKDETILLSEFDHALRGQNLPREEFSKLLEHGNEVLKSYYEQKLTDLEASHPHGYELEYNFGQFKPDVDGIRITGTMDKVVFLDSEQKQVKIVDYKSGKPRSIKPGERLWRQLVFYDILARQSKGVNWQVMGCELEFLTPDSKGKLGTKTLSVTEDDRQQLITELKDVHEKVMNLEFPVIPNPTGDKDIDFWNNFGK